MKSAIGDLAHRGGVGRVGVRFIDDISLNNGFSLAWMKSRELLLDRWTQIISSMPKRAHMPQEGEPRSLRKR